MARSTLPDPNCEFQDKSSSSLTFKHPRHDRLLVLLFRLLTLLVILFGWHQQNELQLWTDTAWVALRRSPIFYSVYFETFLAVVYGSAVMTFFILLSYLPCLDRFKLEEACHESSKRVVEDRPQLHSTIRLALEYSLPLVFLDTFTRKQYVGVPLHELHSQPLIGWQQKRILPLEAPAIGKVCLHLFLALVIYDFLFCAVHLLLHKSRWLYKTVHKKHHTHTVIDARVTNKLHILERVALVLSANQSLKWVGAHPLTRFLFVLIFLFLLIENHAGFDFPFSISKLVPYQLMGGAKRHHMHHRHPNRYFQPLFTYLDDFVIPYLFP